MTRRHPAEVTLERLGQHAGDWYEQFDGDEREAIARVIDALDRIAALPGTDKENP